MQKQYWLPILLIGYQNALAVEESKTPAAVETLDDVVVTSTATKTDKNQYEAPATVRVITRENMEHRRVNRFGDTMRETPGLYLMGSAFGDQASGTNRATVTIRGIQGSNRSLMLLDGQPINNAQTGAANLSGVVMDDIERVDFVPGPFSSLYGSYALSGVMNLVTKAPEKREFKLRTSGGGGASATAADQYNIAALYKDKFDNGLGIALGMNLNESFGYTNSWLNKTASTTALGSLTAVNGATRTEDVFGNRAYQFGSIGANTFGEHNVFGRLYYDFSADTHLVVGYSQFRSEVQADLPYSSYLRNNLGQTLASGNVSVNDNGLNRFALRETEFSSTPSNEQISRYFARFDHRFSNDINLKADFSFQSRTIDTALYSTTAATTNFMGGPGELQALPVDQRTNGKIEMSAPIHISALPKWLASHQLVAGFDANRDDMHRIRYDLSNWRDMQSRLRPIYDASGTSDTYGIYLQEEWLPLDQLSVYLGGRVDNWSSHGRAQQYVPIGTTLAFQQQYDERTFTQFSPKGSFVFKATDHLIFKGAAGISFRPPTTFDLYTTSVANSNRFGILSRVTTEAAPNLQPEKAFSWEIGTELSFDTGTHLSATYFETDLTDLFYGKDVVIRTANDVRQTSNTGEAEIYGVEAAVKQKLLDGLFLFGNVSYAKTRITKNDGDLTTVGKELTRAPQLMWNLGLEGKYQQFSGSLISRYVDKSYNDAANRDVAEGVSGAWDSFTLLDTKLGYEVTKNVNASFAVQNILDEQKFQSSLIPGRTFIGEVSFSF